MRFHNLKMKFSLQESILQCSRLTRASHSNFYPAFSFLSRECCEAMEILYAYTRFTDDLVDMPDIDPLTGGLLPVNERRKRQKLNQWCAALEAVLGKVDGSGMQVEDANDSVAFEKLHERFSSCLGFVLLPAVKMIVDKFHIPVHPFFHLIDGVDADIEVRRFSTFDDVSDYCHQVATSVGFASLAIWGTEKPFFSDEVVRAAKASGIAFQLTNILRDMVEDFGNGRLYLPVEEITRFGLTENQFGLLLNRDAWNKEKLNARNEEQDKFNLENHISNMAKLERKFDQVLGKQFERCEIYYENSAQLYKLIKPRSRKVFGMMWSRYYKLFKIMQSNPKLILRSKRVSLSKLQKLRLYLRWRLLPCFNLR
ncbi:MAG: squalene/phytoene synthase family protein [Planctomycetaceae bacterium]|jgi:phytoene synthase|nr:squalene/phytoene synthase family protein [Planctomycetaceae bacterium]